jgi:hypothetical protein
MAQEQPHIFLFTNFGTLRPQTLEEARVTHNETAGQPDGVAAAKSLGDLSHLVFAPQGSWTGDQIVLAAGWAYVTSVCRFLGLCAV